MRSTKISLASLLVLVFASSGVAAGDAIGCRDVIGELRRTPAGSPVYYMYDLRTPDGELILIEGLERGDPGLLETLKPLFGRADGPVPGQFTICITGEISTKTYSGKTIFRARHAAFEPGLAK